MATIKNKKAPSTVIEIKPTSDNIIVEIIPVEPRQETKSGIILNNATKDKPAEVYFEEHPYQAIVKYIGPGFTNSNGVLIPTVVKPGDLVYLSRLPEGSNEMVLINGQVYGHIRESLVFAIVKHKKEKDVLTNIN